MTMQSEQMNLDHLQNHLEGVDYPADKDAILQYLLDDGTPSDVTDVIERLPDRVYGNTADVMDEVHQLG